MYTNAFPLAVYGTLTFDIFALHLFLFKDNAPEGLKTKWFTYDENII